MTGPMLADWEQVASRFGVAMEARRRSESGRPAYRRLSSYVASRPVTSGCGSAEPSGRRHLEGLVRAFEVEGPRIPASADPFAQVVLIEALACRISPNGPGRVGSGEKVG